MGQHRYIDTLENYLMPTTKTFFFGEEPDWMYQQENAPCHKANKTISTYFSGQLDPLIRIQLKMYGLYWTENLLKNQ